MARGEWDQVRETFERHTAAVLDEFLNGFF
jgi:hypothetical protein